MAARDINPLECSICLEKFQDPRLISCHHSFCLTCLDDFIRNTASSNKFNCPVCRKEVEVPSGGVDDFSANFYINSQDMEKISKSPAENPNSESLKFTDEGLSGNGIAQEVEKHFCEKHPKREVEFFCVDCKMVACSKCCFFTHKTHELLDLEEDDTRQTFLKKLSQINTKLEAVVEQNNQVIECEDKKLTKLSKQAEWEIKNIEEYVERICVTVRQNGEALVTEIRNHISLSKKELEESTDRIQLCPASLKIDIKNTLQDGRSVVNLINTTRKAEEVLSAMDKTVVLPNIKNAKFASFGWDEPQFKIGSVKYPNQFVIEKLNLKTIGPKLETENVTITKQYTCNNFCWSLSIRNLDSTLRFYLIQNDMPGARSILNEKIPKYTITLVNLNDSACSISKGHDEGKMFGWNFLKWDEFIDSSNGYMDTNQDFYVKIEFPSS